MANRIFDLPETRGSFQAKGIISGTEKDRFYTDKKTKNGKDFRAVNFGCEYNDKQTIYMNLNGMPQQEVFFSKRNQDTGKTETKKIPWANRNKFNEDGWRMIGVNLGLTKTTDKDGKVVNDKKTMHSFDACEYIKKNLKDDMSVFIRGALDFSSFTDKDGNIRRSIKYIPNQVSLCKDVDFEEYDNVNNKPTHDFTQDIVFMGIAKEEENGKETGRFIVSAKIITWSDIIDTEFILVKPAVARTFKKNLKPYTALTVFGRIEVTHSVEEEQDDGWGGPNPMKSVNNPTKVELIIDGGVEDSVDVETYNEKNVSEAIKKIKASKAAEQNFSGKANNDDDDDTSDWGEVDEDDGDEPW